MVLLMAEIWRSPPGMVLIPVVKKKDKLPTSTGERRISDPSTVLRCVSVVCFVVPFCVLGIFRR